MSAVQILRVMRHDNNDNISATTLLCIECTSTERNYEVSFVKNKQFSHTVR